MKVGLGILVAVLVAWLGLWVSNTGVLVYSAAAKLPTTRDCRYFIGVSVVQRYAVLAERCEVTAKMGR